MTTWHLHIAPFDVSVPLFCTVTLFSVQSFYQYFACDPYGFIFNLLFETSSIQIQRLVGAIGSARLF